MATSAKKKTAKANGKKIVPEIQKKRNALKQEKIFVLDTSVILYDSGAIRNFKEHNVAIPIQVLEEIDRFKNGNEMRNFEAREFIRFVDKVAKDNLINDWIPLNGSTKGKFKVIMEDQPIEQNKKDAVSVFGDGKYDHQILNSALSLQQQYQKKKVVLVSKDICLRLKAKALNLNAEDYETGKVKDVQKLYTGKTIVNYLDSTIIDELYNASTVTPQKVKKGRIYDNHFFVLKDQKRTCLGFFNHRTKLVERVEEKSVFGLSPRNEEQCFAIHALMNPDIKLVTLQGKAGTGKTLLALACAIEQRREYRQIYVTRPVIPLSNKDIGYLPGDIESKLDPYMQPIWDNLKFIKSQFTSHDKNFKKIDELVEGDKIAIAPLAYIRGRSLSKIFFIVDEAQNLTPHEVKTIISRAGDNTKIVFTGDLNQIDTPYLDSQSNGLSYLIDRAKNTPLFAHVTLEKGERSALANLANDLL